MEDKKDERGGRRGRGRRRKMTFEEQEIKMNIKGEEDDLAGGRDVEVRFCMQNVSKLKKGQ